MSNTQKLKDSIIRPADPRGVRIDGYFGPGLLRPGVGKLVQRTGEPQFCGSMAFRVFSVDSSPLKVNGSIVPGDKKTHRFSGEFMGVTFEGKQIWAADGYLPSSIVRTALAAVDRREGFGFAGDLWCEPAEKTPLGYAFKVYDRRPRGEADPLMQLAIAAGVVEAPAPALLPAFDTVEHIDPETGEVIKSGGAEAA